MSESHTAATTNSAIESDAPVVVRACKHDGRVHRSWTARLRHKRGNLLILDAEFDTEIRHPLLGVIAAGTKSVEYYWTDRWYNVFRFAHTDGTLRNFYCNVNTPAEFADGTLTFTDLDIDVLVAPDFSYQVLDEDEFARHTIEFNYDEKLQRTARTALAELITLIEARHFPFNSHDEA